METRELPFVREMFDSIAPRYDLLNRLLSLRQDVLWRKKMVSEVAVPDKGRVLDVACGTGDVILEILRQKGPRARVIGVDFSARMIALAREKTRHLPPETLCLVNGNALFLPVKPESVHAVTIAFGIRNIQNKIQALEAFHESLVPGGRLAVLELATPHKGLLRDLYLAYFQKVLPLIGRLFSHHNFAYQYLPESVSRFPSPGRFMGLMKTAGFCDVRRRRLTLGVANLFVGVKRSRPE